jgi:hypothetical protein
MYGIGSYPAINATGCVIGNKLPIRTYQYLFAIVRFFET